MKYQKTRSFLGIVLLLLACFFSFRLISYWQETSAAEMTFLYISKDYHELQDKHQPLGKLAKSGKSLLPAMEDLVEKNGDTFAWLYVENTEIDYPVMFTPSNPEYYLRRDFNKKYSIAGTPFLDSRTTEDSKNYIIYGHNMKNGKMFSQLIKYSDETFLKQHSSIQFVTAQGEQKYEIMAAFYSELHIDKNAFPWFNYLKFEDENVFSKFVDYITKESLFPLTVNPVYGDSFLTLVTCSEHDSTGRFVVIARKTNQVN